MSVYSRGTSVPLGAHRRMKQIVMTQAQEMLPASVPPDEADILPPASSDVYGSTPIFSQLDSERPGIAPQPIAPDHAGNSNTVALQCERLQGGAQGLEIVPPSGLGPNPRPLQARHGGSRELAVASSIPEHLGRLAQADPPTPPKPEFELFSPRVMTQTEPVRSLDPSFAAMSSNPDWLRLLALSDHPMAALLEESLRQTPLGPSITDQLDQTVQRRNRVAYGIAESAQLM